MSLFTSGFVILITKFIVTHKNFKNLNFDLATETNHYFTAIEMIVYLIVC